MASKHTRKPSTRAPLPRRTTKGPLVGNDPLLDSPAPTKSPTKSSLHSSAVSISDTNSEDTSRSPARSSPLLMDEPTIAEPDLNAKDLSFLLDSSIYHPLSQLDFPAPFRTPFPPPPSATTPLAELLSQLDSLSAKSHFLAAAYLAGAILSSGSVRSTDTNCIFRLLSIRFSCLELTGNTLLAAQESKALEDLISTFYYYDPPEAPKPSDEDLAPPEHIMPFSLRVQALRLQSIGFSDPRRGVSALYDLGVECREHVAHSGTSAAEREVWRTRLQEISIRVVNALIEMGDLDCACRTLETNIAAASNVSLEIAQRNALLYLKIGDIKKAQAVQNIAGNLEPLFAIAEGRYVDATILWEAQLDVNADEECQALIKQNLAVAYLYSGMIAKTRDILHGLVNDGESFESLTLNLATIYELSSDRSKDLKLAAAAKIAAGEESRGFTTPLTNAAFKL